MKDHKSKREFKCILALQLGFKYQHDTGNVITPTGKILKKTTKQGYYQLTLRDQGFTYYLTAHQFAWYYMYNECVDLLDHKDGNKTNNKIDNLRVFTKSENALNTKSKNVYFCKRSNKFLSIVMVNNKKKQLGSFNSYDEAKAKSVEFKNNLLNGNNRKN